MKSILNAELYELKKTSKTDLYKIQKKKICIQIPISSSIVRSCPCVIALYYDYILEINLTKRQKVYDCFYSIVMILCYLIKIDVGETKCKCLSSTIPHISKNDRLFCCSQWLKSIANNRNDANLMIKQYTVFRYLHQLSQNIGSNTFIRIYSSHTFHARKPPRKGTETAYTIC